MAEMGYGNSQYLAVAHHRDDPGPDRAHEHSHLHIVANGVDLDRKRVLHIHADISYLKRSLFSIPPIEAVFSSITLENVGFLSTLSTPIG